MAKREKAIYAPGELSRVRDKLKVSDLEEARRMAEKLGGQIGYERTEVQEAARRQIKQRTRRERVEVKIGDRPVHRNIPLDSGEFYAETENGREGAKRKPFRRKELDPADDPSVPLKSSYWDRIKMDKFAGQPEFDIKSSGQVLYSILSIFGDIQDYVSHNFVTRRMTEYYKKIEMLVVSTRTMFPRNNARRSEKMKKVSPLVYSILDVIRYWDIERISGDLSRLQAHPKNVKVSDFAEILKAVYRPLFILEQLDPDAHIRGAYKILYKLLYIENPMDAQNKYQDLIRNTLAAYSGVRRDIHYLLYPLFMKTVSAKYLPYETFFMERRHRIMAFLNVNEDNQIKQGPLSPQTEVSKDDAGGEEESTSENKAEDEKEIIITEEEKARRLAEAVEKKAMDRGLHTLEALFPKAGWDRLPTYPDLYPYFVETFDLKKGFVNIAPTDPLQQIFILMRILEELFFGLRYVSFGTVLDSSGHLERVDALIGEIVNNWHYSIEVSFEKEYLPRMSEYVRILEGSFEERVSAYTKKLVAELHWIKRLYFLPFYKFESLVPPPLQKKDVDPIYGKIASLRRHLSSVALGIEAGNRAGGAENHSPCDGIDNPWEPYVFQVPNPLSIRLDALLAPKARNNASLIFFCLAVVTVLDQIVSDENSWAYTPRPGPLFRSVNGEGTIPLTGVDNRIDAEALFKQSLRQRQKEKE